jgi:hypothetical protein
VRKGIYFSKDYRMHKIVVALIINFWFFGELSGKQHLSPTAKEVKTTGTQRSTMG